MRNPGTDGPADDRDSVAAATRALVEATATLSRMLGKQASAVSEELGDAITTGLRDAARGLNDASAKVDQARAPHGARGWQARRDRVDKTRADLLDAAATVFAGRGFEGASVGDVAQAAGYTKGAVYSHFGSKGELFLALARERVLCDGGAPGTTDLGGTAADDLAAEISDRLTAAADDPSMLLALEVLAYAVRHPDAQPELANLFAAAIDGLACRVRDDRMRRSGLAGTADGAPRSDPQTPPTESDYDAALGLLAVANISAMLSAISVSPELSTSAGARVISALLRR